LIAPDLVAGQRIFIEFVSSYKTLASVVQWSISPDALFNSWSAACASFVVWILVIAFIAGTNK